MNLNARVDVSFARVDVKFQTVTVTQFCYTFCFILISVNNNIPLVLLKKIQPNIPSHFGEMHLNIIVDVNIYKD